MSSHPTYPKSLGSNPAEATTKRGRKTEKRFTVIPPRAEGGVYVCLQATAEGASAGKRSNIDPPAAQKEKTG
jgi:hypothetical protein